METSKASGQSTAASRSLRQVMRQHPLFFFFFMAYAGSWIISLPYVLSVWGILPGNYTIAFILKPFVGPTLAAIIMTGITDGKAGLLRLWTTPYTMARRVAVVSVHPAGHSSAALAWDHAPARNAGEFSRSYARLTGELSGDLCHRLLWGCAARGNRLARLRAAPHATALWATEGDPAPGCLVGLLACAVLPDAGSRGRARHATSLPSSPTSPCFF